MPRSSPLPQALFLPVSFFALALLASNSAVGAANTAGAGQAEKAFESASLFTVKIRTSVQWPFDKDRKGTGSGAGFLVDAQRGWILTNAHVANRSPAQTQLMFKGGKFLAPKKLYVDPHLDFALLSLSPEQIPASAKSAELDCSFQPKTGEPVGTMGHPSNFNFTGTQGVISGLSYRFNSEFLQTDTPINPGNSGGSLFRLSDGKVLGLSTQQVSGSQNNNFAVSIRYVCTILALMRQGKDPSPPHLNWIFFNDTEANGVLKIARLRSENDSMGAKPNDLILAAGPDLRPIKGITQLYDVLRGNLAPAQISVLREGKQVLLTGDLTALPWVTSETAVALSGALFGETRPALREDLGAPPLSIYHIESGSLADHAELASGDFILSVNGQMPKTVDELEALLRDTPEVAGSGKLAKIILMRTGGSSGDGIFGYLEKDLPVTSLLRISQ